MENRDSVHALAVMNLKIDKLVDQLNFLKDFPPV